MSLYNKKKLRNENVTLYNKKKLRNKNDSLQ